MAESLRFDIFAIDRASHVLDKVGDHAEKMGGKLGRVGKVAAVGLSAIAAGVGALAVGFGVGLKAASDYQKLTAQTGAVLKSTGEKAGVSAEHVKALAESISGYSGQTREAVTGGENLLLTFTNIQNKAGKGNKIFDQATTALANMTQALGEDPKQAAIQLGKALNDPVKGITALRRVGVSFSADQIKVVKHLVATGHTMQAQKLILKELNTEFGGSAKAAGATFAGSMERLKNSLMDVLVNALTPMLPALTKFAGFLANNIGPALAFVTDAVKLFFGAFTGQGADVGAALEKNTGALNGIIDAGAKARDVFDKMRPVIVALVGWFRGQLLPALEKAGAEILPKLESAFSGLVQGLKNAAPAFKILGTYITAVLIPVLGKAATIVLTVLGPAFRLTGWILGKVVAPAMKLVIETTMLMIGDMLHAIADAFGWVPGIGKHLKKAAADFDAFRKGVNASLNGIKPDVTIAFHSTMDANLRKILSSVGGQKGAKIMQSIHGQVLASGTPSFQGGLMFAGDAGVEAIEAPPGTRVHTASATSRMGGGNVIHLTVNAGMGTDGTAVGRLIVRELQKFQNATGPLQVKVAG